MSMNEPEAVPFMWLPSNYKNRAPLLKKYLKKHKTIKGAPKLIRILYKRDHSKRKLEKVKLFHIRKLWPRLVAQDIVATTPITPMNWKNLGQF